MEYTKRNLRELEAEGIDIERIDGLTEKLANVLKEEKATIRESEIAINQLSNRVKESYLAGCEKVSLSYFD